MRVSTQERHSRLYPISDVEFVTTSNEIHRFELDRSGQVVALLWSAEEEQYRAKKR